MNSQEIVLEVQNLSKCFKIYSNPWKRVYEWLSLTKKEYHQKKWSLKNVSLSINRGEFVGIIGQNGAGKSTLLKIITGILEPTEGKCFINGKILSLLELGTDFNLYLSGLENAIRSAELLGFPDDYIQQKLEEIAEFAELSEYFYHPVGLYSSGMKARLAFSLFTFLECDILILDEVMAVGDLFFRQKCYSRLQELIEKNTTIILVTHAMDEIQKHCNKVIFLDQGEVLYQGQPKEAVRLFSQLRTGVPLQAYQSLATAETASNNTNNVEEPDLEKSNFFWPDDSAFQLLLPTSNERVQLIRYAICNAQSQPTVYLQQGEEAYFCFEFLLLEDIEVPLVFFRLTNKYNDLIHGKATLQHKTNVPLSVKQGNKLRFYRKITLGLALGEYVFGILLAALPFQFYSQFDTQFYDLSFEELNQSGNILYAQDQIGFFLVIHLNGNGFRATHFGTCDLPGDCGVLLQSSNPIL